MESNNKKMGSGLRLNEGKTRYDLNPVYAVEQMAKVMTKGSEKYAPHNWELGMAWSKCLASAKRHIAAIERGEDFDPETGLLHSAHAMTNMAFLTEYYKIYPQGDDRNHLYLHMPKIGLDVDEVLADWVGHWTKRFGQVRPETWNFDRNIMAKFEILKDDKEFWMSIPVKTRPQDIHFEPHCYITSRIIPKEWTEEWLDRNGFPTMPVYSVPMFESKIDCIKASGVEVFVDDRFENFVEINNAGICCYLFDAPHNQRYNVGHKRIKSLLELTGEKPSEELSNKDLKSLTDMLYGEGYLLYQSAVLPEKNATDYNRDHGVHSNSNHIDEVHE